MKWLFPLGLRSIPFVLGFGFFCLATLNEGASAGDRSCLVEFANLETTVHSLRNSNGTEFVEVMESLALEGPSLSDKITAAVLDVIEVKIKSGKYGFASKGEVFRADEALFSVAVRDGIDLSRFPGVKSRLESETRWDEVYRSHLEEIFDSYPAKEVAVAEWKDRARLLLAPDLLRKGVEDVDRVARSIVRKIERQARTADALAESAPVNESVLDRIHSGDGGNLISGVSITTEASFAAQKSDLSVKKKLAVWLDSLEKRGMKKTRELPGFHDHPLKGEWAGVRSVYLTRMHRVLYLEIAPDRILITRVSKHDYRLH